MPAYVTKTLEELRQTLLLAWRNANPTLDIAEGSDAWLKAGAFALALLGPYAANTALEKAAFSDTAKGAYLVRHAAPYGIVPKPAAGGAAALGLRVRGTNGSPFGSFLELRSANGKKFQNTAGGNIPPGLFLDVGVQAVDGGLDTNLHVGDKLKFSSPPAGIQADADIVVQLTGGADAENDDQLLVRLNQRKRNPVAGGTAADYESWALAVPGVATAKCFPIRRGLGTVDVSVLVAGSGAARLPSGALQAAVAQAIDLLRPTTVADFQVVSASLATKDVYIQVKTAAGYEFDWDATAPTTASGCTSIVINVNSTAVLTAGKRVQILGEQSTILTIDSGTQFTLTAARVGGAPGAGVAVLPGGPLVLPVQAAIKAYFDSLRESETLYRSEISYAGMGVTGVVDNTLVQPAANYSPPPPSSSVELVVYGKVEVVKL